MRVCVCVQVDFSGEVVELGPVSERVSWAQLHAEWETHRQDKARARILLLYSPDTKLFRELQAALKSFLQLACHSEVYDLFDDALFDSIALDPSLLVPDDREMLEDLILAAFGDAKGKADRAAAEKMQSVTSGLPLPPGFKLPF